MSAHLVPMHSSALCQTWFVIRKRTSFKAARESRFGGRWNLQNVQGGSVGGYGLLTWFLWISPPPFRTPLDRYCWGFLYCSWRQVLTRCNFGFKSSSTDCWSKPFLIKLFLPALYSLKSYGSHERSSFSGGGNPYEGLRSLEDFKNWLCKFNFCPYDSFVGARNNSDEVNETNRGSWR